jgi:hypothetical protein
MKTLITMAVAAAFAATAGLAAAQDPASTARIDKRQQNQQQRIEKGVASGQLNEKEAARLQKGQQRVQKAEDKALEDGKVTKKERKKIERMQDQQSKKIARERHDKQKVK